MCTLFEMAIYSTYIAFGPETQLHDGCRVERLLRPKS